MVKGCLVQSSLKIPILYGNRNIHMTTNIRLFFKIGSMKLMKIWCFNIRYQISSLIKISLISIYFIVKGPHNSFPGYIAQYPWPTTNVLMNGRGTFDCSYTTTCTGTTGQCMRLRDPFMAACNETAHQRDEYLCTSG